MPRILLDTDPGIDDALALFLALASPEIHLEAVTTVSGNVPVADTTRNALALLELAGRADIPVASGCPCPLVGSSARAAHVHGDNGLGGILLPTAARPPLGIHAVDLIIETILAAPGEITLVPIGPLTNIALALRREPRLAQLVREVVVMGGALRVPGNITPAAEFNIYVDPQAAHIVLHAGWPIRLVTLDTTTRTLLKRAQVTQLDNGASPVTALMRGMVDYYCDIFGGAQGISAIQMHDPLCLAAAFRPDLLTWEEAFVDVELNGTLTLGETVAFFAQPDRPPGPRANVLAAVDVQARRFIQFYLARIQAAFGGTRQARRRQETVEGD
ncbi:MAG TPA: nucleoside hydrolase [Ktedonobacteraceae bacterium]|jgi:purine nucleosidase